MISWASFTVVMGMLVATYSTRLIGFFMLRNRTLSPRAAAVMEAAPGCVLFAASRWGMMPTVLVAVASAAILGRWMN